MVEAQQISQRCRAEAHDEPQPQPSPGQEGDDALTLTLNYLLTYFKVDDVRRLARLEATALAVELEACRKQVAMCHMYVHM